MVPVVAVAVLLVETPRIVPAAVAAADGQPIVMGSSLLPVDSEDWGEWKKVEPRRVSGVMVLGWPLYGLTTFSGCAEAYSGCGLLWSESYDTKLFILVNAGAITPGSAAVYEFTAG